MFFALSKLLFFLIAPFNWIVVSIALFFFLKNQKWRKRMGWTALSLFIFFSNTVIYKEFNRLWEVQGVSLQAIKKHDAIIVLGGMFEYNNDLKRLNLAHNGDRIWQGLNLYFNHKARKLIISGDNGYFLGDALHESIQAKADLAKWNIPYHNVIAEKYSRNTFENAQETAKLIRQTHPELQSFILVSSAQHMRRANACFIKAGLNCTLFPTGNTNGSTRSYKWDEYFMPSASTLDSWQGLIKEWIGYISYFLTGKL